MPDKHKWTEDDEVIGYYLYRFGNERLTTSRQLLVGRLGMSLGSMGRKVGNFEYLDSDGKRGLSGCSSQARKIYNKYKAMPNSEFAAFVEGSVLPNIESDILSTATEEDLKKQLRAIQNQLDITRAKLQKFREI